MFEGSIAILTWGLRGGSLANFTSALVWGLWEIGVRNIDLVYVVDGIGSHISLPKGINLVPLGSNHSRSIPLALARYLKDKQPDFLISVSSFVSIPAIIGWLLAGKATTKLIASQHSTMGYKAYIENKHNWKFKILPWLARLLYPMASAVHANSQEVLEDLFTTIKIPLVKEKTFVIDNPINLSAIDEYKQTEPEHPWLLNKKTPVIISVGRLAKQKNFPLLLRAFQIVKQNIDAKLIILGKGDERHHLEKLVQQLDLTQDVDLAGFTTNPWSYMNRADLFVLSSDEEPFGLVIVEAMTCGLPIVATDAIGGGPRTILNQDQYGNLVPVQNPDALAKAMLAILTDPNLQTRLSVASLERCQAYQPKIVAQQWLEHLTKLSY